uniref:S-locus linked F-box protein type-6 n=1 Tax=Petunia hybrida TaxID=4102 RepID=E2RZI5_PETHY|nr:S-locus linked F-box protein type-6 [Petunia x hybrida]
MADGIIKKLSEDVVIFIFFRLPVKSLMRFKFVSKSFFTLIQSSTFINLHLYNTTAPGDEYILLKRCFIQENNQYKTILSFLAGDDDDYLNPIFQDLDVTHLTSTRNCDHDQLIGPCHGLMALMDTQTTILFNPSTRNYRPLRPSPFSCPQGFHRCIQAVGFGFDTVSNDYKVVRISIIYKVDYDDEYPEERDRKFEVYDLGIDYWRELDNLSRELTTFCVTHCSQMFYKGACHWIASLDIDAYIILCFDMSSETFRSLKIPESCHIINGPTCRLALVHDTLTLIYYPYPEPEIPVEKDFINIWFMNEYNVYESWIRKYTIRGLLIDSPLTVWKGYLLLYQSRSGCLMSYNLNYNDVREFNFHGYPKSLRAIVYKDSLISIPRESEHTKQVYKF